MNESFSWFNDLILFIFNFQRLFRYDLIENISFNNMNLVTHLVGLVGFNNEPNDDGADEENKDREGQTANNYH